MAHEIESIAYAHKKGSNREEFSTPWHGLGEPVTNDLTPAQMLEKAKLNWTVDRVPSFIEVGKKKIPTGRDVLVRSSDSKIMTHISEAWEPVQNKEAFDFFHEFVMAGDMEMNTAGSLRGGNMVWALARVKKSFTVGKTDRVDSYLLFSNPHEYGRCIDVRFTAIRVVCNNTLTLALGKKGDGIVRLNHRRKFDPEMVKKTLGISGRYMDQYKEMADVLAGKKFTVEALKEYYEKVFPSHSKKDKEDRKMSRPAQMAYDVLETQPGAKLSKGTWWQAFNSATYAIDHLVGHSDDTRLTSAWYGPNRTRKVEALKAAVEMAK
jgi:phage/plasmid-like protein (TIGR03299 family)